MKIALVVVALLFMASPAQAQERTFSPLHIAIGGFMVGQFTDLSSTEFCIGKGTCSEVNPLFRAMVHQPVAMAVTKGSLAVAISALLLKTHQRHAWAVLWTSIGLTVGQAWLTWHNVHVGR